MSEKLKKTLGGASFRESDTEGDKEKYPVMFSLPEEVTRVNRLRARMDSIERAGRVMRCHTTPCIHPQSIAAHCYGVAWWCYVLSNGAPNAALLLSALSHDSAEHKTGDIPAPTKRALGISEAVAKWEETILRESGIPVFDLSADDKRILKLSDTLELIQHCVRERSLGNRTKALSEMFVNAYAYSSETATTTLEKDAVEAMRLNWEDFK